MEVSTPLCYASAATGCALVHSNTGAPCALRELNADSPKICQCCCKGVSKCGSLWNQRPRPSKQGQSRHGRVTGASQRLPGSTVWPLDRHSWNRTPGKILLSRQDAALPPAARGLKPDCRGQGSRAAVPPPLQPRAPERFRNVQPPPGRVTPPRRRRLFRRTQHYGVHWGGSRRDPVSLRDPNGRRFPHVWPLSLKRCKRD